MDIMAKIKMACWVKDRIGLLKADAVSAMAFARPERSGVPVGCALIDTKHTIYTGANLEVLWQQSYHAEETAICGAITHDSGDVRAIVIAANRELFTPCGRCMDLIMKYCVEDAIIIHYNPKTKKESQFTLRQLMPHYPIRSK